ncbi:MAG: 4Fe-4S dicluster domain-containing protein [Deltaproteobacteria bacterium]|nr:4Fe-4S dicluster domain-containing protein [Deltaproteobacteria bacterium]
MPRWGMVIDLDRCTGCQACTIACRMENNVPFCGDKNAWKGRAIFWNKVIAVQMGEREQHQGSGENGHDGQPVTRKRVRFLPLPCMHCDRPPCTMVCPVRATTRNVEGIVMQVPSRCIGCRLCQAACPYSRRYFNWQEVNYPGSLKQAVNPDVSIRTLGVIEKCTFCVHRLQQAREQARAEKRELREGDYVPACVEACPAKARTFGDLDNPEHAVAKLARNPRAFRLLPELGTHPKVIYLQEGGWQSASSHAVNPGESHG